ncbi:Uncharacterised protein [Bordetella pertussis]|nr:Uncharacterised protein [Bordetella pertussis]
MREAPWRGARRCARLWAKRAFDNHPSRCRSSSTASMSSPSSA